MPASRPRKTTRRKAPARKTSRPSPRTRSLTLDHAIVAVIVGAMLANEHVSAEESERAHNLTWAMRRFRRKSGETVGRVIARVREDVGRHGHAAVVQQASRFIPPSLRPSVLAVAADLVLLDGTLQRQERQFLSELARQLKIAPALSLQILKVIAIKNAI